MSSYALAGRVLRVDHMGSSRLGRRSRSWSSALCAAPKHVLQGAAPEYLEVLLQLAAAFESVRGSCCCGMWQSAGRVQTMHHLLCLVRPCWLGLLAALRCRRLHLIEAAYIALAAGYPEPWNMEIACCKCSGEALETDTDTWQDGSSCATPQAACTRQPVDPLLSQKPLLPPEHSCSSGILFKQGQVLGSCQHMSSTPAVHRTPQTFGHAI